MWIPLQNAALCMFAFLGVFLLALPFAQAGSVTWDQWSSGNCGNNGGGQLQCTGTGNVTLTFTASVSSSANFLIVSVANASPNELNTIGSVKFNGVALTRATTTISAPSGGQDNEDIWYIATSGVSSKNVVIKLSGSENGNGYSLDGVATSFINVNTATPFRGFASQSGNSTSPSVTIASAANDLVFDTACSGSGLMSSGQTNNFTGGFSPDACGISA